MYKLFVLVLILFLIYYVSGAKQSKEMFSGLIVENAFTDTKCVDDTLPLLKFHPRSKMNETDIDAPHTFRCLSLDGTTCIDRNNLDIPALTPNGKGGYSGYHCTNTMEGDKSVKNVNFYLSRDGIVQANPQRSKYLKGQQVTKTAKAFFDFDYLTQPDTFFTPPSVKVLQNKNVKYLTCTQDGIRNPNHWCGKIWNKIQPQCETEKGKYGEYQSICKNVPKFLSTTSQTPGVFVTEMSSDEISTNQKLAREEQQKQLSK